LKIEAQKARHLLDSLGAAQTQIVVSGDLDEYKIRDLQSAPIDSYGVGTQFVTGSGAPTCNFVYKITESAHSGSELTPVGKQSWNKATPPGHRWAYRDFTDSFFKQENYLHKSQLPDNRTPINQVLMVQGQPTSDITGSNGVAQANQHFQKSFSQLPPAILEL
jgi:nicotinate phosphoribosyltransferase